MSSNYVAYFRVSTVGQQTSGLGLEAQRHSVEQFVASTKGEILSEFTEVESGTHNDRPQLAEAIQQCRKRKAQLLIARLDRLSRNAAFLLSLRDSGVSFVAVDMPHANKLTIGIMAVIAEDFRDRVSQATKDGLQAAKRRGILLGNPRLGEARERALAANARRIRGHAAKLRHAIQSLSELSITSHKELAEALNRQGFKTTKGHPFHDYTVKVLLERIAALE